jgi:hypothetical protein
MKWFVALNELCPKFLYYAEMVKVAVHTALKHTSLVPHFLYDGQENLHTDWLRKREVPIIHCRTLSLRDSRSSHKENKICRPWQLARALLRVELPRIALEFGMDGTSMLYTDCDVMFIKDVPKT